MSVNRTCAISSWISLLTSAGMFVRLESRQAYYAIFTPSTSSVKVRSADRPIETLPERSRTGVSRAGEGVPQSRSSLRLTSRLVGRLAQYLVKTEAMNRLYFAEQRDVASSCHSERSREWSEWDERHGRLRSVGRCERIGRRMSQISERFP